MPERERGRERSTSPVPNLVPLIEGAPRIIAAKQELPNLPPDGRVDTLVHRYKHTEVERRLRSR